MSFAAGRSVNRIEKNEFLNQRCALGAHVESMLRAQTVKIVLQHNRAPNGLQFERHAKSKKCQKPTSRDRDDSPEGEPTISV